MIFGLDWYSFAVFFQSKIVERARHCNHPFAHKSVAYEEGNLVELCVNLGV